MDEIFYGTNKSSKSMVMDEEEDNSARGQSSTRQLRTSSLPMNQRQKSKTERVDFENLVSVPKEPIDEEEKESLHDNEGGV